MYIETLPYIRVDYLVRIVIDYFKNGITRDADSFMGYSLPDQVCPAAFGIGHQDIACMINNPAIHFFRNPVVITPVSRLHMKNGNSPAFGDDC